MKWTSHSRTKIIIELIDQLHVCHPFRTFARLREEMVPRAFGWWWAMDDTACPVSTYLHIDLVWNRRGQKTSEYCLEYCSHVMNMYVFQHILSFLWLLSWWNFYFFIFFFLWGAAIISMFASAQSLIVIIDDLSSKSDSQSRILL